MHVVDFSLVEPVDANAFILSLKDKEDDEQDVGQIEVHFGPKLS